MELNRRSLITGLVSLVAAPAIVRASSLMPVKAVPSVDWSAYLTEEDACFVNTTARMLPITKRIWWDEAVGAYIHA